MQHDKATLLSQINTLFPDNNTGQITPERVRNMLTNILDSSHLKSEVTIPQFNEYVNVKDYGAVGNGIAEDQDAFNDALATRKNVFVPGGEYLIKGDLITYPNQHFVGAGAGTHLSFSGSFTQDKCIVPSEGVMISNMSLSSPDSNTALIIISLENLKVVLDSLLISSPGQGIYAKYTSGVTGFKNELRNCIISECVTAILTDRDNTAPLKIQNCLFYDNTIALDLHSFLLDITGSILTGDKLVVLRNDNTVANPHIQFRKCAFASTVHGVVSEIAGTSYVLTFADCEINTPLRMALDMAAIVQFLRCDIAKLSNAIVSNEVTVRFADNTFHEGIDELIIPAIYIKSIESNVVYDSGAAKYILKLNIL